MKKKRSIDSHLLVQKRTVDNAAFQTKHRPRAASIVFIHDNRRVVQKDLKSQELDKVLKCLGSLRSLILFSDSENDASIMSLLIISY